MKKYRVLGINTNLWTKGNTWFDEYDFNPNISFSDYDAVIICTNNILYNFDVAFNSPYLNKKLLSVHDSHEIVEDYNQLRTQITDYTEQGKIVFIILGDNENCYILTGDNEYGLKREFDTNSFLPFTLDIQYLFGEKYVRCETDLFKEFFDNTGSLIEYTAQFGIKDAIPLLKIPNSDKLIAAELSYKNGRIVFLPSICYDYEDEKKNDKCKKQYLNELYKLIDKLYRTSENYTLPEWTNCFQILNEKSLQDKLQANLSKLSKLKNKIEKEKEKLESIQNYKALLTETGTPLESIVKKVLSELGFELQKTEIGRSDIIAKYNDTYIVAEIKGVSKSATERHANQLEKWVSIFRDDNESKPNPKPLLIVNGFKDTPVFKRTEIDFPVQMQKFSIARDHALVSTTQLLCLYIDTKTNPDNKDELINELLSTVGVYNRYTNITDYLQPIAKDEQDEKDN